jgi:hypothetical protein
VALRQYSFFFVEKIENVVKLQILQFLEGCVSEMNAANSQAYFHTECKKMSDKYICSKLLNVLIVSVWQVGQ